MLNRLNIHPSRKLGQNFLIDPNMLSALVQDSRIAPEQRVLEIGPGLGALTQALLDGGCDVTAIELDHRLAQYLAEQYAGREHFRLIQGDACKLDFDEVMGEEAFRCVANLPYSCSTPFLANITAMKNPPTDLCVLLQREMADRLVARHGTKDYGLPTVKIALRYNVKLLRVVPPKVFFPPPEVSSAFVRLEFTDRCGDEALRKSVENVAAAAFSQRRKKSRALIEPLYPNVDVEAAFKAAGLDVDYRADAISVSGYIALARELDKLKSKIN